MPLFFAYYRVLANVIELRQAHWGWLPNLAVADPLHILPVLIIASMFLVQFLTPSPGMDPAQRRMMAFMMPAIFGFSMWSFASGLALYWGTGNLLNLGIQLAINNSSMGKEMKALAAKRAAKKNPPGPPTIRGKR
jgi:YidC/Oxa1 family membrane protein insertase